MQNFEIRYKTGSFHTLLDAVRSRVAYKNVHTVTCKCCKPSYKGNYAKKENVCITFTHTTQISAKMNTEVICNCILTGNGFPEDTCFSSFAICRKMFKDICKQSVTQNECFVRDISKDPQFNDKFEKVHIIELLEFSIILSCF